MAEIVLCDLLACLKAGASEAQPMCRKICDLPGYAHGHHPVLAMLGREWLPVADHHCGSLGRLYGRVPA
jgi:hypothetical protein